VKALQTYVGQFDFSDDPLDVALRKLLMEVGLPRETQQIDRVMEAFARRYLHSNPTLFTSEGKSLGLTNLHILFAETHNLDHPYILAFSLIMLHTDAFNKSNKRKMTKAAYIKNTRLPGVAPEILDVGLILCCEFPLLTFLQCFYDNILFAPFIFIEDQLDVNGQLGLTPETTAPGRIISPSNSILGTSKNNGQAMMKSTKVDPYYLITNVSTLFNGLQVIQHL
jgi:Sec7-like guanine-nucleotide exchange factor